MHVSGTGGRAEVSQSYGHSRYMTACADAVRSPIKFNGSLFTVGRDLHPHRFLPRKS